MTLGSLNDTRKKCEEVEKDSKELRTQMDAKDFAERAATQALDLFRAQVQFDRDRSVFHCSNPLLQV